MVEDNPLEAFRRALAGAPRIAAAALCLLALPASAPGAPAAEPRFTVRVFVYECYTASAVQVFLDGRPLRLTPPAQRNDSTGLCYNGSARVGRRAEVRVHRAGGDRRIELRLDSQSRFLHVTPEHAPFARLAATPPLLD